MDRRRFSTSFWCDVFCGFIGLLVTGVLAHTLAALIVELTGNRKTAELSRNVNGPVAFFGAAAAFLVTFWREYHKSEPTDPPPGSPKPRL